jgi:hypothetical protein
MVVFLILAVRLIHIIQILFQFLTFTDLAVVYKSFWLFVFFSFIHYMYIVFHIVILLLVTVLSVLLLFMVSH